MKPQPEKITNVQISALKKADYVCFRWTNDYCRIEADKKKGTPTTKNPFPQDATVSINTGAELTNYSKKPLTEANQKAFAMIHSAHFVDHWRTIANLLKAGDEITLEWVASNNTDMMEKAGLRADELQMRVDRGEKTLHFFVCYQVSSHASSSMVNITI